MKFKLFAVLALVFAPVVANAAPEAVEVCIKSRFHYKWGNAFLESESVLTTGKDFNEFAGQVVFPDGNYVFFDYGTESESDMRALKLNTALTAMYQEVEDENGEKWLVAKKMPNQICR